MKITEKVGAWLQMKGHTKDQLAEQLGITTTTLNNKLRGKTEWSWTEVIRLSDVIGCELKDFR